MAPIFHMKNDPVSGVLKANLFVRLLYLKDCTSTEIGLCASSACKVLLQVFCAIVFSIYFAFSPFFCCKLFQEVSGWSRWLEICVAQALFGKYFSRMVAAIKKSHFRS